MDDTAHTKTDYDAWATDPGNLAFHLERILESLASTNREQAQQASVRRRWPYLVNPQTGHLNGLDLCWICASAPVHTGRLLPRFRACRWCLAQDGAQAATLGLRHLLPVFDWPVPPVRGPQRAEALSADAKDATTAAWCAVSVLDRWRRDSVHLAYGWMDVPAGEVVDLLDWQRRLSVGPNRSRACWDAYVDGYQPALRRALREQRVSAGGRR